MDELRMKQLIFLDSLVMLNLNCVCPVEGSSLEDLIERIFLENEKGEYENLDAYATNGLSYMTTEEWGSYLESLLFEKDGDIYDHSKIKEEFKDFLSDYVVINYTSETDGSHGTVDEGGFGACTVVKKNGDKVVDDVIIAYRTTSNSAIEWSDDVLNANEVWTDEMDKSVTYINDIASVYGGNITVTGHSKGGNRAQYVTIVTDWVSECLSFDGQGFSQKFIDFYRERIEERKDIIHQYHMNMIVLMLCYIRLRVI